MRGIERTQQPRLSGYGICPLVVVSKASGELTLSLYLIMTSITSQSRPLLQELDVMTLRSEKRIIASVESEQMRDGTLDRVTRLFSDSHRGRGQQPREMPMHHVETKLMIPKSTTSWSSLQGDPRTTDPFDQACIRCEITIQRVPTQCKTVFC